MDRTSARHRVDRAAAAMVAGGLVVLVDDTGSSNGGGALVFAAPGATVENSAFVIRHSSGFLSVAVTDEDCDRLGLSVAASSGGPASAAGQTVTVDAVHGTTTGISAADRATTIRAIADPASTVADFTRPGHVVPVRVGKHVRAAGTTVPSAAVVLAEAGGCSPIAAYDAIVSTADPVAMANEAELVAFAADHGLPWVTVGDVTGYLRRNERGVRRGAEAVVVNRHGEFRTVEFLDSRTGGSHTALVRGDLTRAADVAVSTHVECAAGDVFGSFGCACAADLDVALSDLAHRSHGAVIYLRGVAPHLPRHDRRAETGEVVAAIVDDLVAGAGSETSPGLPALRGHRHSTVGRAPRGRLSAAVGVRPEGAA